MKKQCYERIICMFVLCAFIISMTMTGHAALNMIEAESYNVGMSILPTPGKVVIDGDLSDWDFTGRIWAFKSKDTADLFGVENAFMYDDDYLYYGAKVKDFTPMRNIIDPYSDSLNTWKGDCIQMNMETDRRMNIVAAYHHEIEKASLKIDTWKNDGNLYDGVDTYMTVTAGNGEPDLLDWRTGEITGAQQAFQVFEDGSGYYQEIRIPWKLIASGSFKPKAGDFIRNNFQYMFDGISLQNLSVYFTDLFAEGITERTNTFATFASWAKCTFEASGNVPVRQYVPDASGALAGRPIRLTLPPEATKFTIVIEDSNGNRIRNLAGDYSVSNYIVDTQGENNIVEVLWDYMDDFNNFVPPGSYNVRGLYHQGLDAIFDASCFSPSDSPWLLADKSGAWLSDHWPPMHVAAYGENVAIAAREAENGCGVILTDLTGQRKWGVANFGALALGIDDKYVYTINSLAGDPANYDFTLVRYSVETSRSVPFVLDGVGRPIDTTIGEILGVSAEKKPFVSSIASNGNVLVLALPGAVDSIDYLDFRTQDQKDTANKYQRDHYSDSGSIVLLDIESAKVIKRIKADSPMNVAFGKDGKLYGLVNNSIAQIDLGTGIVSTIVPRTVEAGFEPVGFAIDTNGNFLVFDRKDSQVKAFSTQGRLVYTIGKKGGRAIDGKYDSTGLHNVGSVAVDSQGKVWAVERNINLRRVAVYNRDGSLYRDLIGNIPFGSTKTTLHEQDPTIAIANGVIEMTLDRENQSWETSEIIWMPSAEEGEVFAVSPIEMKTVQRFRSDMGGVMREFLFDHDSDRIVIFMKRDDGNWKPVTSIGKTTTFSGKLPGAVLHDMVPYTAISYCWNDENGDGLVQSSECEFSPLMDLTLDSGTSVNITSDFRFIIESPIAFRPLVRVMKPYKFSEDGAPMYSFGSMEFAGYGVHGLNFLVEGEKQIISSAINSSTSMYADVLQLADYSDGKLKRLWHLPNKWPAIQGAFSAPIQTPGVIIGPMRIGGMATINGEKVFAARGYYGLDYFVTLDGLYVGTVFQDSRLPYSTLSGTLEDNLGKSITTMTNGSEAFNMWFGVQDDGVPRITGWFAFSALGIAEIKGLDTIERFDLGQLKLSKEDIDEVKTEYWTALALAQEETQALISAAGKTDEYTIYKTETPFEIDGGLSEWANYPSVSINNDKFMENGTAKFAYDDENLYIAFDVNDPSPMQNVGTDYARLFKSGDIADVFLGFDSNANSRRTEPVQGDMRILLTKYMGEMSAVVMSPVDKDAQPGLSMTLTSPTGYRDFDRIEVLKSAKVALLELEARYIVEAAIPWSAIGGKPEVDKWFKGDAGLVVSNFEGTRNSGRMYWQNKGDRINIDADIPNEATLEPNLWGKMMLSPEAR